MPTAFEDSDALGLYHTGAVIDGGTQPDPDACLGGNRSATVIRGLSALISDPIPPVVVERVNGQNEQGVGTIIGTDVSSAQQIEDAIIMSEEDKQTMFGRDTVTWKAPLGTEGAAVIIRDGETLVIEDAGDASKSVRVSRDGFTTMKGEMGLGLVKDHRNALGMGQVSSLQRLVGEDYYRGVMLRAHGTQNLTDVNIWLKPLGTRRDTDVAQLPAGANPGTIETTGTFADWEPNGGGQVRTFPGLVLKENFYYSSRTDNVLTVSDGAHRGILGVGPAAGAGTDVVFPISLTRIGIEAPGGGGDIQTIVDEFTAPLGIGWNTPTFQAIGLNIAALNAGDNYGLWFHRQIPADAEATPEMEIAIEIDWLAGGTRYNADFYGLYRVQNLLLVLLELNLGEDEEPDLDAAPDDTNATLPFASPLTPPGAGEPEFRAVLRQRDRYGLISLNQFSRGQAIDSNGDDVAVPPSPPEKVSITNSAGGELDVVAQYQPSNDPSPANNFRVYHRGDGTDPVPGVDTPATIALIEDVFFGSPTSRLDSELGPNPIGTEMHTLVRSYRSGDDTESTNSAITVTVIDTETPVVTKPRLFLDSTAGQLIGAPTVNITTFCDAPNNVHYVQQNGKTELWADTLLVWRLIYDSAADANNGLWTTFGYAQGQISGTPAADPCETDPWNAQKTIYFSVGAGAGPSVRRMKVDVTATQIHTTSIRQVASEVVTSSVSDPVAAFPWHTLYQVFNNATLSFKTVMALDTNGELAIRGGWQQRGTIGEFADV